MIPHILEGQVVKTDDPDQMGRVKVWIPSLDGDVVNDAILPWASYVSPISGFTTYLPAGNTINKTDAHASYGFWSIPKRGAIVYVFCVNGDEDKRCYFAHGQHLHRNRSLPAGRNFDPKGKAGPWGDAGDDKGNLNPIEPAYSNLREQFQNKITESEAITRGLYERQTSQANFNKDGKEGYIKSQEENEKFLESQTHCWVTPGHHAIIFQDNATNSRVRIKTAEGHQIILDDANERIYISTSRGKSWIEMDVDGHIHLYGQASVSVRAGEDINLFADRDINIEANRAINVKADNGDIRMKTSDSFHFAATKNALISACQDFDINSDGALRLSSKKDMDLKTSKGAKLSAGAGVDIKSSESMKLQSGGGMGIKGGSGMKLSAPKIDLNGPSAPEATEATAAQCAQPPKDPTIVPGHEPWKRPGTNITRNKNWKA